MNSDDIRALAFLAWLIWLTIVLKQRRDEADELRNSIASVRVLLWDQTVVLHERIGRLVERISVIESKGGDSNDAINKDKR